MIFGLWHLVKHYPTCFEVVNCFQVFMIFGLWHRVEPLPGKHTVVNCFQVFMIFGLWHQVLAFHNQYLSCELLSSFYDLWSLTSKYRLCFIVDGLWIAFKFLWSLVFDICWSCLSKSVIVVNCFQVFMIFGLWHLSRVRYSFLLCCELLSSFYDLWSLTSQFDQSHNSKGLQDVISIKKRAE